MRLLIACGLFFMSVFLWWYATHVRIGHPVLYWMLTGALAFKLLRMLHEWYHYLDIGVPHMPVSTKSWTVDVLTTFCAGEPYEMIVDTLRACQKISYPHITYLCDEADDPYLKQVCADLNIVHVTRKIKVDAKAGNINNALKKATGEICVVLDPDHIPIPEFLDRVLPYFEDPQLGYVQVVQAYGNQLEDNLVAKGAAQQTYTFYGPMMMCMNNYGTAQAIGANCTFRRAALDSIGGHAAGLSEDMHTAMQIHSKGWKSVYVPEILTRGLVPATMSAYYKQQLKWSRGTFELLFTTYFGLFRNFTWQQKIHYFTIPLYYLFGLFGLVDILIPVIALVTLQVPWEVDFFAFSLYFTPLFGFSLLIRQYSQKWFLEEHERGIHMLGGLLRSGTWWIFLLGFVYTIFRIKVPYIPTPKDDKPENSWLLSLPNFIACFVSLGAIVYGLSIDWSPYSFLMAGFAFTNACILGFIAILGQHKLLLTLYNRLSANELFDRYILSLRSPFWKLSHFVFHIARSGAVVYGLLIIVVFSSYFMLNRKPTNHLIAAEPPVFKETGGFYTGIYIPQVDQSLNLQPVQEMERKTSHSYGLVSTYLTWGPESITNFPDALYRQIYQKGAIPMITWEPFTRSFPHNPAYPGLEKDKDVCKAIINGALDGYIEQFALKIKALQKPVFIRLAHEPDNPVYPWSATGGNTAQEYVASWQYVVNKFVNLGISNVTWVWNPWDYSTIDKYYPGKQYVDWIGITALNYGNASYDGKWRTLAELYAPFRKKVTGLSKPVMLAEFGSTGYGGDQAQWLRDALQYTTDSLNEVKSLVFFYSNQDKYWISSWRPDPSATFIEWTFSGSAHTFSTVGKGLTGFETPLHLGTANPLAHQPAKPQEGASHKISGKPGSFQLLVDGKPFYIKGVAYNPAHDWRDGNYPLTIKQLKKDFAAIKNMGANTIRRYHPGVYDKNILSTAQAYNLKVLYGFWFDPQVDYLKDSVQVEKYIRQVEKMVQEHKNSQALLAWGIGNETSGLLKHYFAQPYLGAVRQAYMHMIERITSKVHQADPLHPVFTSLEHSWQLPQELSAFREHVPSVDVIGINSYYRQQISLLDTLFKEFNPERAYLVSEFGPKGYWNPDYSSFRADTALMEDSDYKKAIWYSAQWNRYIASQEGSNIGAVAFSWRDRLEGTSTWYGLTDAEGRYKPAYYAIRSAWTGKSHKSPLHDVFIKAPHWKYEAGKTYEFSAVTENNNSKDLDYQWYLCEDEYLERKGKLKEIAGGMRVRVTLPNEPSRYRLYLYVSDAKGNVVTASEPVPVVQQ